MRFIIKQRILALGMQYRVFDHTDTKVFEIRSELLSRNRHKDLLDPDGNQLGWVQWPLQTEANFHVGSGTAHMAITTFTRKPDWQFQIDDGRFYTVTSDSLQTRFIMIGDGGNTVATVKNRATFFDSYVLELDEQAIPISYALLLVALIDHEYFSYRTRTL